MKSFYRRFALAGVLAILVLGFAGTTFAQDATPPPDAPPPPACVPDEQTACVKIVFFPATLKADLFLGTPGVPATADAPEIPEASTPTAQVQQSTLWVSFPAPAAGQTAAIIVKNIHDGGAGEGTLYWYPNIARTVNVPFAANQTTTVTLSPVKTYIRGKIQAKCDPKSVLAGEDVSCQVSIDGVVQTIPAAVPTTPPTPNPDGSLPPAPGPTATLAAGQTTTFIVDPGKHDVKFDLVGANASLWAPPSLTKTVTVAAGNFPQIATATFNKAGHLVAKLAQADAGWVGDFYLDGVLVATQVGSIDQFVGGNTSHKVEVKKIALVTAPLIRPYQDASTTAYVAASGSANVTITMTKVPDYQLTTPSKSDGTMNTLTKSSYVAWFPVFSAKTPELATNAINNMLMLVTLDGVIVGDVTPYRKPPTQTSSPVACEGEANVPCYNAGWFIPFGRLSEGPHLLYAEAYPLTDIFVGWTTYSGVYFSWDESFSVAP